MAQPRRLWGRHRVPDRRGRRRRRAPAVQMVRCAVSLSYCLLLLPLCICPCRCCIGPSHFIPSSLHSLLIHLPLPGSVASFCYASLCLVSISPSLHPNCFVWATSTSSERELLHSTCSFGSPVRSFGHSARSCMMITVYNRNQLARSLLFDNSALNQCVTIILIGCSALTSISPSSLIN